KKVYLIIEADRMNDAAANSLLKTLEEPPPNSVLILVTSNPSGLLYTIRSRCHEIRFGALTEETVRALLLERDVSREKAEVAARLSGGQMDRALDLVNTDRRETALDFMIRLEKEDPVALAIEFAEKLEARCKEVEAELEEALDSEGIETETEKAAAKKGARRREVCENLGILTIWYRDLLMISTLGRQAPLLNADCVEVLERQAATRSPERVRRCIDAIDEAGKYVDRNIKVERNLINLFLALAGPSRRAVYG
ncbi:ATP-binding protein, partial [Candidatus Hydrogenedentota bacterium]